MLNVHTIGRVRGYDSIQLLKPFWSLRTKSPHDCQIDLQLELAHLYVTTQLLSQADKRTFTIENHLE